MPKSTEAKASPVGQVRLATSVHIPQHSKLNAPPSTPGADGKQLTQETLQHYWDTLMEQLDEGDKELHDILEGHAVEWRGDDRFDIIADSTYFEEEFRPHRVTLLERLRQLTRRPQLNCQTRVVYVEKEKSAYAPRDKYDRLQAINPTLDTFRVLFPEIDF